MKDKRQWWYFTFGVGQPHEGHYVKFFGTYDEARTAMVEKYGARWAFQYNEAAWEGWVRQCKNMNMEWMLETELTE